MAKDTRAAPIVIKLYSKPEVPQVDIDIKDLFSDSDKCESETDSCFSGFESESKPDSGVRKKKYVKKVSKNSQKDTIREGSHHLQAVNATEGSINIRCNSDTSRGKLGGPGKNSLSERQIAEKTGSRHTVQTSKIASPQDTSVNDVSRAGQYATSELEPVPSDIIRSKPGKYVRKVIVLHKDFFDIPYMTPNKHMSLKKSNVRKNYCGSDGSNKCQKNYGKVPFIIKTGEISEMPKGSNSLVKIKGNKKCNVYQFVNSERAVDKRSPTMSSTHSEATKSQSLLSQELQQKLLPPHPSAVRDITTVEEIREHNDLARENLNPSCFSSEHDYSSSSVNNPRHATFSHNTSTNVSQKSQSVTPTPRTESAEGSEDFTCRETEAAQIMLDLFYSGKSTNEEESGLYESGSGNLDDELEGPEERAEINDHVVTDSDSASCESCVYQERVSCTPPPEGNVVTDKNLRSIHHHNHEIRGTLNIDRALIAGPQGLICKSQKELAQRLNETNSLISKTPSVNQEKVICNKRSCKCATSDISSGEKFGNIVGKTRSTKLCAGMQTSTRRSKRFQGLFGTLGKPSKKLRESQILMTNETPGRRRCIEFDIINKPKRDENEKLIDDIQNKLHQSGTSEDVPASELTDSNEITPIFKDDEIEINYKAGKRGVIDVKSKDGISYQIEQNMFSAPGLVTRQSPHTNKLQDISSSHILQRTRNIRTFVKRIQECQVVLKDCCKILKSRQPLRIDIPKVDQDARAELSPVRETEISYINLYSPVLDFNFEGFLTPDIETDENFTMSELECGKEMRYPATNIPQRLIQVVDRQDNELKTLDLVPPNMNIQEPSCVLRSRKDFEEANSNTLHSEVEDQQLLSENKVDMLQKEDKSHKIENKYNPEDFFQPVQVIGNTQEAYYDSENPYNRMDNKQDNRNQVMTRRNELIRNKCHVCGKSCFTKAKLKRHVAKKHGKEDQLMVRDEASYQCKGSGLDPTAKECVKLGTHNMMLIPSSEIATAYKQKESYEDMTKNSEIQKNHDDNHYLEIHTFDMQSENNSCKQQEYNELRTKEKERTKNVPLSILPITDNSQIFETSVNSSDETNPLMCSTTSVIENQSLVRPFVADCKEECFKKSDNKIRPLTFEVTNDNGEVIAPNSSQKRNLKNPLQDNNSPKEQLRKLLKPFVKKGETIMQVREDVELQSCDLRAVTVRSENISVNLISQNHHSYVEDNKETSNSQQESFVNEVKSELEQKDDLFPVPNREGEKVIHRRKRHKTIIINGKRWYPCSVCKHKFSTSGDLARHMRKHTGERPYKCSICSSSFKEKGALNRHNEVHKGSRPYNCRICESKFTQKIHLKTHLRIHTGEKPFRCEQCGKAFSRIDHLKGHLNTHTSDRPYKCKICSRAFKCCANLSNHKRIHDEDKRYKCQYCPAAFRGSHSLKVHLRFHTGEKRIHCPKLSI